MVRAMLSKSLTQFSVDGWGCVPSLLFTWGQTIVEVMKIMGASFKMSHACTATFSAPNPIAGHNHPTPLPKSPGHSQQVWVSLLWGHHSFLIGPGALKALLVPSKSLSPQSCVKDVRNLCLNPGSGSFLEETMATYSNILAWRIPLI